jgi:RES domain-containing protein
MEKKGSHIVRIDAQILGDAYARTHFCNGLRYENRFTLSEESEGFIFKLLEYAEKYKTINFKKGRGFFRARKHEINQSEAFPLDEMSAPPKGYASHGRLNPKGIPYLYLASNSLTAVSEVRPWVGGKATVAEFELVKDVSLVNFSARFFQNVPKEEKYEGKERSWKEVIAWMFSAPFDPRDDTAYVPTQYLSERIKGLGYDGIICDSPLNPNGYNVTLFDPTSAEPRSRQLARVQSIKIKPTYRDVE